MLTNDKTQLAVCAYKKKTYHMLLPFVTKQPAAGADFLSWHPLPLKQNLTYHSHTKLMRNGKASTNILLPPISQAA